MIASMWRIALVLVALAGASLPAVAADTFYKWESEDGTTHYGTRPPNGVESTAIQPKTGHSEPVNYSHGQSDDKQAQASSAAAEQSTKDPARCEAATKNADILGRGGRVREPTDDGSFRYLSEEEKADRLEQARQAIEESC
ncbi:DUF4124 domain-containing protein [Gilvimarinus xylanilyticus]|uniref:DUF4124 domain-containing protein n=1 Tax=Gilvimarinus xylanilyticus TaxID=2944139 RepID=A0A9X2HYD7_9GAMM|nr:DUF4124 domain-containing protein [Gilvimarinus xylanilyticus]MCP8900310.1 DUF4124 domain-containing protein [Gilvimarinus xylanilyticus]